MAIDLSLEVFQECVPKQYKKRVTQEIVDEINHLTKDPDYGQEFREAITTYSTILAGKEAFSLRHYVDAIKFYSLTATGLSLTRSYIAVFPERLQARVDRGQSASDISGEASRYNSTDAVNKIRAQALVPLHLVNQGTTQLAINTLTSLMLSGRSEVARVSAATALLKELRPPEAQKVELQLGLSDAALEAQEKQTQSLIEIAENQRRILLNGGDINDVQQIHVTTVEAEVIDE